jgi:hypothetical protein
MKTRFLIASAILAAALAGTALSVPAQAKSMKDCAAEWDKMKAANQTGGKTYKEFSKECMSGGAAAAPAAPPPTPAAAPAKPAPSGGRQAMIARERACGADWKADKAAGKIAAGMKWPQYWSECNKRKKAEGM